MKSRILIQQFEDKSNQGGLFELGITELVVQKQFLGARLTHKGCSSRWVTRDEEQVPYVEIGGREYIVRKVTFPKNHPDADFEVSLPYDHEVLWHRKEVTTVLLEEVEADYS